MIEQAKEEGDAVVPPTYTTASWLNAIRELLILTQRNPRSPATEIQQLEDYIVALEARLQREQASSGVAETTSSETISADPAAVVATKLTTVERARKLASEAAARSARDQQLAIAPTRHPNRDFFVADIVDYSFKSDMAGMDAPIFSLSTKTDMKVWQWSSQDGKRSITVRPGVDVGRATIFDKDILLYAASQLVAAINAGKPVSKTVRYAVYDYLVATNRKTDGEEYARHRETLRRLESTSLETNIKTGRRAISKGFGIIDSWEVVEKDPEGRAASVEITLSDWLFNAITTMEVLTISEDYFRLRKALERRIYELARKHVGQKASWMISLTSLYEKSGSQGNIREFRRLLKNIVERDDLPDFLISTNAGDDDVMVVFTRRAMIGDKSTA
jgi:plasmid replication initiation protein